MDENTQSNQDVNTQADMQTADTSSVNDQTSDAGTLENSAGTQENSTDTSETLADGTDPAKQVPFSRLQSEIEKRAALEERIRLMEQQQRQPQNTQQNQNQQQQQQMTPEMKAARDQLKGLMKEMAPELGFVSKQEVQQQQAAQAVKLEQDRLGAKYTGANGLPKYEAQKVLDFALKMGFTRPEHLEVAYKMMHENAISNVRLQKGVQQTRSVQTETSNGSGSANTGVSSQDLLKAAQGGDKQAMNTLIKRRLFTKGA